MTMPSVLCIIPARGGSKRITNKNIRPFAGRPLIAHTIEQAKALSFVDRIVVDTDSPTVTRIAKKCGAEVPFLRPKRLATDKAQIVDSVIHLLERLGEGGYTPDYMLLLQTTSPLREIEDINATWKKMKEGGATTVLTVCPTHPRLYHIDRDGTLVLGNKTAANSTNIQAWKGAYMLNGCFAYLVKTSALIREHLIITKKTKAVVCPRWRSVDLDDPEDWVLAEFLFKNKSKIESAVRAFTLHEKKS